MHPMSSTSTWRTALILGVFLLRNTIHKGSRIPVGNMDEDDVFAPHMFHQLGSFHQLGDDCYLLTMSGMHSHCRGIHHNPPRPTKPAWAFWGFQQGEAERSQDFLCLVPEMCFEINIFIELLLAQGHLRPFVSNRLHTLRGSQGGKVGSPLPSPFGAPLSLVPFWGG